MALPFRGRSQRALSCKAILGDWSRAVHSARLVVRSAGSKLQSGLLQMGIWRIVPRSWVKRCLYLRSEIGDSEMLVNLKLIHKEVEQYEKQQRMGITDAIQIRSAFKLL